MATDKHFKDNPALGFISSAQKEKQEDNSSKTIEEVKREGEVRYKHNPEYIEVKSRRLQLVLKPSLYDRIKAQADESGLSVNEYCHRILDNATKG